MNSFRVLDQHRVGRIIAAAVLLFAAAVPTMVSAAQLTTRSIALSSSSVSATGVTYNVNFTAATAAGAVVVQFCSNSPLLADACTAPTGFTSASATTPTAGYTMGTKTVNQVILTGTIAAGTVNFAIANITNPSSAGTLYARIATYTDATAAAAYPTLTAAKDQGAVAMSITPTVSVSGAVLESMTFCVSGTDTSASANCASTTAPVLKLGQTVGSTIALQPGITSTGNIYTQISTNAAGGAVVSLKSDALNCGGLIRSGAPTACDILPAQNTGITAGAAAFGVKTATATSTTGVTDASGTYRPYDSGSGAYYSNSAFAMKYVAGNATGVTSVYGDPFLDTNGAQVNNKNMALTFGAQINNSTPAGLYSANLSLIATGTF